MMSASLIGFFVLLTSNGTPGFDVAVGLGLGFALVASWLMLASNRLMYHDPPIFKANKNSIFCLGALSIFVIGVISLFVISLNSLTSHHFSSDLLSALMLGLAACYGIIWESLVIFKSIQDNAW
jgi:hypothetical protein